MTENAPSKRGADPQLVTVDAEDRTKEVPRRMIRKSAGAPRGLINDGGFAPAARAASPRHTINRRAKHAGPKRSAHQKVKSVPIPSERLTL